MTQPETNTKPLQGKSRSRREILEEFVAAHPGDPFGSYGLAMECAKLGDHSASEAHFRQLIKSHPEYVAAYFHFGQLLAKLGRLAEARMILNEGVSRAAASGDAHARSELRAALDDLG